MSLLGQEGACVTFSILRSAACGLGVFSRACGLLASNIEYLGCYWELLYHRKVCNGGASR